MKILDTYRRRGLRSTVLDLRSEAAALLVEKTTRLVLHVATALDGNCITYPTAGLDRLLARLPREEFDELRSHGDAAQRFEEAFIDEAERHYEEMLDR